MLFICLVHVYAICSITFVFGLFTVFFGGFYIIVFCFD